MACRSGIGAERKGVIDRETSASSTDHVYAIAAASSCGSCCATVSSTSTAHFSFGFRDDIDVSWMD